MPKKFFGMNDIRAIYFFCSAILIGIALLFVRVISHQFAVETSLSDHPYIGFVALLIVAGLVWTGFIWLIPRLAQHKNARRFFWLTVVLGFSLRALFLGSTPIYENDWNRYLWDGAALTQGINPYSYTPQEILEPALDANPSVHTLNQFSSANDDFADRINYGHLTTIYPPIAQAVFGLAALIKPLNLDVLRLIFIVIDGFSIWLMVKTLALYGRAPLWAVLYILNPLVIYAGFNAVHMEIILMPFLLLSLLLVKSRPHWAAVALACAAAVKLWPLLLAPVLFRAHRKNFGTYIRCALIVAGVFLLLTAPMLLALGGNSGLSAYAQSWQRNSFMFPLLTSGLDMLPQIIAFEPDMLARILIAVILTGLSLWLGFARTHLASRPASMMALILALFLLSPTGYPWYALWFLVYLPFAPSYGAALLSVTVALYYTRYALSAQDLHTVYEYILLPIQFAFPAVVIIAEYYRNRRTHA